MRREKNIYAEFERNLLKYTVDSLFIKIVYMFRHILELSCNFYENVTE